MDEKKKGFPNLLGRKADKPFESLEEDFEKILPSRNGNNVEDARPPEAAPQTQSEAAPLREEKPIFEDEIEDTRDLKNTIPSDLSEEDKKEIYDAIDLIRRKLSFARNFSKEEREDLIRLGKTGRKFVEKAHGLVDRAPGILPRSFNVGEFLRDAELYQELGDISDELKHLYEQISDTEAAVGSDAFSSALVVYQSGKLARTGDDMDNLLSGWRRKLDFD